MKRKENLDFIPQEKPACRLAPPQLPALRPVMGPSSLLSNFLLLRKVLPIHLQHPCVSSGIFHFCGHLCSPSIEPGVWTFQCAVVSVMLKCSSLTLLLSSLSVPLLDECLRETVPVWVWGPVLALMAYILGRAHGLVERTHQIIFSQDICCLSLDGEESHCVHGWDRSSRRLDRG